VLGQVQKSENEMDQRMDTETGQKKGHWSDPEKEQKKQSELELRMDQMTE
jgi:hypothetical protein